ncbi:methylated-DNA--[protein]-cysteine S-methyltransferase [Spirosoma sp. KUDC1026]|uniref:methylated-DNA--[protein]-cysteine S-methyltransferase n=1 Tax=Spirosoma sp. KUDC1026 TaxID=2745947 RepID=UPI00159BBB8A|nr:methylated-DNA--[protein]-cysteine S-methyltransferase [Spirosoma sp. KUDC1026]QKZ13837.1 methylated-DNA--[protein]-cysteine S-methyltransferase [Spirosoma sp. KUDC1026]
MTTAYIESPLGLTLIKGDEKGVSQISCLDGVCGGPAQDGLPLDEPVAQAAQQLTEYFAGTRQTFDFLISPAGTAFQQSVWQLLRAVPFGTTQSYLELTRHLGDEKAIRAVAAANGRNPLWIVVPCHRIVGSDGSLTGYAGGLWRKEWLLKHEGAWPVSVKGKASATAPGQLSLF